MTKIIVLASMLCAVGLPAQAAGLQCTPPLVWHAPPWEKQAIQAASNVASLAAAFTGLDGLVTTVATTIYNGDTDDALTAVKCIADAVVHDARGPDNATMVAHLKAWITARGGLPAN